MIKSIISIFIKPKTIKDKRRSFTQTQKKQMFIQQDWKCNICSTLLDLRSVVYDHIVRHSDWGETILSNWQALCPHCHNIKTFNENLARIK